VVKDIINSDCYFCQIGQLIESEFEDILECDVCHSKCNRYEKETDISGLFYEYNNNSCTESNFACISGIGSEKCLN
jgi:hypothetical protein